MNVNHIGIWVNDLERMGVFYTTYFGAAQKTSYYNPVKNFESLLLQFNSGPTIELMRRTDIHLPLITDPLRCGYSHLAISVGSIEKVDELTCVLECDGYIVNSKPRVTGDGYYESVITDPEGNLIEITI